MQWNPLFKCQGLEVRRRRSKFHLFSCVLSTQKLPMKWNTSGLMSGCWEAGSVSCCPGKRECTRVRCSTKMIHVSSILFLGKKDTIHLVLSVLIILYCISAIKRIFISRKCWYLENIDGGRSDYVSDYFCLSIQDIQAFEKECRSWK